MTDAEIELFNDSFQRCMEERSFLDVFYEHFLGSSKEVRQKFQHTDFRRQKKALRSSLLTTMMAICRREEDLSCLDEVAERHSSRDLDIRPELYELWLESMLHAVKTSDRRFDDRTEAVWRKALQGAMDYCVSKY
jgi:hemoglobin-like flavoprotein